MSRAGRQLKKSSGSREREKQVKVVMFPVHNMAYPRNSRVRRFLADLGYSVIPINRGTESHSTPMGKLNGVIRLFSISRDADVIILSEMSIKYSLLTWLASRINKCVHVVDGFIGLYETEVEDKQRYSPKSIRAKTLRVFDRIALVSADIYLTDTDTRADALRMTREACKHQAGGSLRTPVVSLPVGAPTWAEPAAPAQKHSGCQGDPVNVLYYGNYIPLHGLTAYVDAWSAMDNPGALRTVFIGGGQCYRDVYERVAVLGLMQYSTFLPPVMERELKAYIHSSDLVLGIFGDSSKARTVIANKVWQGLACGRPVLTRKSDALGEIKGIVSANLIEVEPGTDITASLERLCDGGLPDYISDSSVRLESYVESKFYEFDACLRDLLLRNDRTG